MQNIKSNNLTFSKNGEMLKVNQEIKVNITFNKFMLSSLKQGVLYRTEVTDLKGTKITIDIHPDGDLN